MNAKILSLCFVLLFTQSILSQEIATENNLKTATEVLDEAYKQAKEENKNVIVVFTASWCKWCKRMLQNFNDYKCEDLFKNNYVIKTLTVKESKRNKHLENPGATELLAKYRAEQAGIPYFLIFDAEGKLLAKSENDEGINLGCPASQEEVAKFKEILKNTSKLTDDELAIIEEKFLLKK